jgi:hypothetical protein
MFIYKFISCSIPSATFLHSFLKPTICSQNASKFSRSQCPCSLRWGLRSLTCWDCGFEFCQRHVCLYLVNVVCCQVEVPALGWSLVQRSRTECGVCECDREAGIMRPWPTRDCCTMEINSALFGPPFVFSYPRPPIIRQSVGESGLYYTVKNLWQALSWIFHETYKGKDSLYVSLCPSFNRSSKIMEQ